MNNYLKIFFLFFLVACTTIKDSIKITQKETVFPVYALLSSDTKRIVRLCFPNEIKIENTSSNKKSFIKINYEYNSIANSIGNFIRLYKEKNNSLEKISNNKKKTIFPKENKDFIFYTVHYIDTSSLFRNELKYYNEKMLQENKDTLHIGTVSEFKTKHKELFEKLTKNDSISIQFLDGKKLGERIIIPVKWKD